MPSNNDMDEYKSTFKMIQDLVYIYSELGHVILAQDFNTQIDNTNTQIRRNQ